MSKIKTSRLQARFDDSTLVIGLDEAGHTTRFEGNVILPQYVTNDELEQLLLGYNSIYKYITRDEFKQNSNKVYIQNEKPALQNPDDPWEFDPRDGDVWFDSKLDNVMIFQTINDVGDWRKPQFAQDIDDLKVDVLELAGELEAVIRTAEKGFWKTKVGDPSTDPVQNGEVMFSSAAFTTPSLTIKMSVNDADGKTHNFTGVNIGQTYIEFVEDDEDYLLFKPTSINLDEPGIVVMEGTSEIGKGVAHDGSRTEVRAFEADANVDVSALMPKAGGDFTGDVGWKASDIIAMPAHPDHLWTNIVSSAPKDAEGVTQTGNDFGVKVHIGAGNTIKNQFKVSSSTQDILLIPGGQSGDIQVSKPIYYTTDPKTSYSDREIPHWRGIRDWVYSQRLEKLSTGYEGGLFYTTPKSLSSSQFALSSSNPQHAGYAYFYKLYDYYNRQVNVNQFFHTRDSMIEIWEKDSGTVIAKYGIQEWGTSSYSGSDVYYTLQRIWGKSYTMYTSKQYCIVITSMIRR